MRVLAIESTCDETAGAVVENFGKGARVIKSVVASSAEMHRKYGGVVPEVAAREQVKSIIPVISEALDGEDVDAVAVSYGPGLMGSLLIGVETAKALAWAWKKPLLKVNHMTAHVMANWIVDDRSQITDDRFQVPKLPAVGLVVSGGHTDLILMKNMETWEWIGGTRDDAAGEAFDKAARLLGLPYPGGPEIDKAASQIPDDRFQTVKKEINLPRPLIRDPRMEMSFSGIKAAIARLVNEIEMTEEKRNAIAREFSEAVCEVLIKKTLLAVEKYRPKCVVLAGGVAANRKLREALRDEVEKNRGVKFFVPELKYCGDNAAMVGAVAILRPMEAEFDLKPEPGLGGGLVVVKSRQS